MANPSSSMDFLGMLRNKLEEAPPDVLRGVVEAPGNAGVPVLAAHGVESSRWVRWSGSD